jgi:hypothetical protein
MQLGLSNLGYPGNAFYIWSTPTEQGAIEVTSTMRRPLGRGFIQRRPVAAAD